MFLKKISLIQKNGFKETPETIEKYIDDLQAHKTKNSFLDIASTYFVTVANYNYYYRASSFRTKGCYIDQIKNGLKKPDLFNELINYIDSFREFKIYSVKNTHGIYGLGFKGSVLAGDRLIASTIKPDKYDPGNTFNVFISHELFEYLTRRNKHGTADQADLPDIDIFITYELIWQEILRHYFLQARPEVIDRIKNYLEPEIQQDKSSDNSFEMQMNQIMGQASGWDPRLAKEEKYIRNLARRLASTQASFSAPFIGWQEFSKILFDEIIDELAKFNLQISYQDKIILDFKNSKLPMTYLEGCYKKIILSELDLNILRYLWSVRSIADNNGVQREYKLIGSQLPEQIGQALAFLEVASFPPVGADFSSGFFNNETGGQAAVYSFNPSISFSYRGKKKNTKFSEIMITTMDDKTNSPETTVILPNTAGFEESITIIVANIPMAAKELFYSSCLRGFYQLAKKLIELPGAQQKIILTKYCQYIQNHTSQGLLNDNFPLGTGEVAPLALAYELSALAKTPLYKKAAKYALKNLKDQFPEINLNDMPVEDNELIPF